MIVRKIQCTGKKVECIRATTLLQRFTAERTERTSKLPVYDPRGSIRKWFFFQFQSYSNFFSRTIYYSRKNVIIFILLHFLF